MSPETCRAILLLHESVAARRAWGHIQQKPGITGWELLRVSGLSRKTLTKCLDQMTTLGLVRREGRDLDAYLALTGLSYSIFGEV